MAEKFVGWPTNPDSTNCFNPHHTGEWLKSRTTDAERKKYESFNPHHTGEWLKSDLGFACGESKKKFQSSSYWRMAEKSYEKFIKSPRNMRFNPHHTGEWLKSDANDAQMLLATMVSILIILANG